MEREDWVNLNGEWTYKIIMRPPYFASYGDYSAEEKSAGFDNKILVPYPPESKLSGVEEKDIISCIFYHRVLDIPAHYTGKQILLHFGAVFYHAEIFIDGKPVDFHDGGSSSFTVDISAVVKAGQTHNLVVKAESNLWDGSIPSGKQSSFFKSYRCFYTRITGIWQTVWMEAVNPGAVRRLVNFSNINDETLILLPEYVPGPGRTTLKVAVLEADKRVAASYEGSASSGVPVVLRIPGCRLWSPEDPYLYTISAEVFNEAGESIDKLRSYAGMRSVHIAGGKFYLNNKPFYHRLVLDQGYYPDGLWTAPDDAALKRDIELGKQAGFNGARLHQKVFEQRYYYWADKLGYVCWSESPSWGLDYNAEGKPPRNFLSEWAELVSQNCVHPSILVWTPLNETFQFANPLIHRRLHRDAYRLCKMIDPSRRPVNDSSGYIHFVSDVWTSHTYEQNPAALKEKLALDGEGQPFRNFPGFEADYQGQPYLVDEYGGVKWDPATQTDANTMHGQNLVSWGYGDSPKTLEEFYARLESLTDAILQTPHIQGYCYTQLTDVEQEKNGVYFYDRTPKFDPERIRKIFSRIP
jgi:beta-galactosidase/beta-glucuronidase